ncbi:molybdopterin cofactor-binding domain-containing protein [Escherichia coli]
MRGYGAPQVVFAVESMLDDAATALGIDPVEIRLRNAAREGDANPLTGKRIYSAGLPECLEKGRKIFEWEKRRAECQNQQGNLRRGVGVACFSYTSNTWPVGVEIAGARLLMNQDETIEHPQSGTTEVDQVPSTVFSQMVAGTVGVRVATFGALFQLKYRRYAVQCRRICLTPELCCRACAAQCGTIVKEKIVAHAAVMLHRRDESDPDKGHMVLSEQRKSR